MPMPDIISPLAEEFLKTLESISDLENNEHKIKNNNMKLELNHRYLVKNYLTGITELKCIEITTSAYKIQFENKNPVWATKQETEYWDLIDDLGETDFIGNQNKDIIFNEKTNDILMCKECFDYLHILMDKTHDEESKPKKQDDNNQYNGYVD
jgi:hypothetical protein